MSEELKPMKNNDLYQARRGSWARLDPFGEALIQSGGNFAGNGQSE
jgi:hypothetical protein